MKFLFILFVVVPIVEIYVLISIGGLIGAPLTIALIIFTAILGAYLVRQQGFSTLQRVQSQLSQGEVPAIEILEGLFLLIAGALLLTPGFVTDLIGFACLTPPLRQGLIKRMLAAGVLKGQMHSMHQSANQFRQQGNTQQNQGRVIDAEYTEND